jgi:hypothetical protein
MSNSASLSDIFGTPSTPENTSPNRNWWRVMRDFFTKPNTETYTTLLQEPIATPANAYRWYGWILLATMGAGLVLRVIHAMGAGLSIASAGEFLRAQTLVFGFQIFFLIIRILGIILLLQLTAWGMKKFYQREGKFESHVYAIFVLSSVFALVGTALNFPFRLMRDMDSIITLPGLFIFITAHLSQTILVVYCLGLYTLALKVIYQAKTSEVIIFGAIPGIPLFLYNAYLVSILISILNSSLI